MSKISPGEAKAPAGVSRGVTAGSPVPPPDWETRLREARAKREQALSRQRTNTAEKTPAPLIGPWPKPQDDMPPDRTAGGSSQASPGLPLRITNAAPPVTLVFSAAAGLAFGAVIGLGFLFGARTSPTIETTVAPAPTQTAPTPDTAITSLVQPLTNTSATPALAPPAPVSEGVEMADASYWTPALYPVEAHPMVADPLPAIEPASQAYARPAVLRPPAQPLRDTVAEQDAAPAVAAAPEVLGALDEAARLIAATVPGARPPDLFPSSGRLWVAGSAAPQALAQPQDKDATFVSQAGPAPLGAEFFLHAPDGLTQSKLNAQVAQLEGSGVILAGIGREGFRVSKTHLRYYSPETASLAQAVAEKLGVEARDFTQGNGNTQRIEVWVSGRPKAAPEAPKPTGFFARLRDSFRNDP